MLIDDELKLDTYLSMLHDMSMRGKDFNDAEDLRDAIVDMNVLINGNHLTDGDIEEIAAILHQARAQFEKRSTLYFASLNA